MLVMTLSALVASLAAITTNIDNRAWIIAAVIGLLGLWCLLLAIPAAVRSARTATSERTSR